MISLIVSKKQASDSSASHNQPQKTHFHRGNGCWNLLPSGIRKDIRRISRIVALERDFETQKDAITAVLKAAGSKKKIGGPTITTSNTHVSYKIFKKLASMEVDIRFEPGANVAYVFVNGKEAHKRAISEDVKKAVSDFVDVLSAAAAQFFRKKWKKDSVILYKGVEGLYTPDGETFSRD